MTAKFSKLTEVLDTAGKSILALESLKIKDRFEKLQEMQHKALEDFAFSQRSIHAENELNMKSYKSHLNERLRETQD